MPSPPTLDAIGQPITVGAVVLTLRDGKGQEHVVRRVAGDRVVVRDHDGLTTMLRASTAVVLASATPTPTTQRLHHRRPDTQSKEQS